nr:hypothetical protein [Oscillospiraceae bacterium]
MKKWVWLLLSVAILSAALPAGSGVYASGTEVEDGTWARPYVISDAATLVSALGSTSSETVYLRLGADIFTEKTNAIGPISVRGSKCLDLNGCTLRSKLAFYMNKSSFSLFVIEADAELTLGDSKGGGEVIYDRYIPSMGETNAETDVFLSRNLCVFEVRGALTVNSGEITAGHYESEYYTYTDGYNYLDSRPSPGWVDSVTPGTAVLVRDGGRFTANGGEYYGRGFTVDNDRGKESTCAAVILADGAQARIYAGDFYGKSNADVFSVHDGADIQVIAGNFYARYDDRVTVDKFNGIAYYLSVDCGRIGLPLRAFDNNRESFTHIYRDSVEYFWSPNFTQRDDIRFLNYGMDSKGADLTVETLEGNGSRYNPYLLKNASDVRNLMFSRCKSKVYIKLNNDIEDCPSAVSVVGNVVLDLNGHLLKRKFGFNDTPSIYSMFVIDSGNSLTLEDSAGGGEVQYDRVIPGMNGLNEQTDIILDRPLTVFDVSGSLTVNSGEITAGHYESEYYTFRQKYASSGTSPGTVNSITPGNAVVVRDGGRFTANGGEFYGRGFTIDDNGEKEYTCAAVRLENGAAAIINDGDFYGKSDADVFSVAWGANVFVYSGTFNARYDDHVTVDKFNDKVYYVNVDCGRVGLPLRAFNHAMRERIAITVDDSAYAFSSDYSSAESDAFEAIGQSGTGATVAAAPLEDSCSRIERQDGSTDALTYSTDTHELLVHANAMYYNDSFGDFPAGEHSMSYSWRVIQQVGSRWAEVDYTAEANASNRYYFTADGRLDLYDLARSLSGGMRSGSTYRIYAHASEFWEKGDGRIYTTSENAIEVHVAEQVIGDISLPDSVTGIVWPAHGNRAKHVTVEQDTFTATLTFEACSTDGSTWAEMSERSDTFLRGQDYRLRVTITPKAGWCVDVADSVRVGDGTVADATLNDGVLTGYLPLTVAAPVISSVVVKGSLTEGCKLCADTPLCSATANVLLTSEWEKDGAAFPCGTALYGSYRATLRLEAKFPYAFSKTTVVKVFGTAYPITGLSADCSVGFVETEAQSIACSHKYNANKLSCDATHHFMSCSVCGATLVHGAHTFGDWVQNGGNDVRTCSVCGYQESVSNGKSSIPCIRLTGDVPLVGAPLSAIGVYAEDEQYATLEHAAEWFKDEIDYTTAIPDDTVMEAGSVYYAFVKLDTTDDFYFTEDTTVRMLNSDAADLTDRHGVNGHLEAYFKFTPRTPAKTQITLGTLSDGGTYGDALSGFGAVSDGKPLS